MAGIKKRVDGIRKEHYANGQLKLEMSYKNGKPEGKVKDYYENGQLKSAGVFKNGKLEGSYKKYYSNGQFEEKGVYVKGKIDGVYKRYCENGEVKSDGIFKETGKYLVCQEGLDRLHYPNGQLEMERNFKKVENQRVLDGLFKKYFRDGQIQTTGAYKDGKRVGVWKEYYKSGKLRLKKTYKNGVYDGS